MKKIDFKKVYKQFYMPKKIPAIIDVPTFNYIAIEGKGNPNEQDGEYQEALQLLYAIVFTIKMSKMGKHKLDDYYEYVMPPLEGLWWMPGKEGIDYQNKQDFHFVSMIAQPDFVDEEVFVWACEEVEKKKGLDTSKAKFISMNEGCCVTCMHLGSYDDEPATLDQMHKFADEMGYEFDLSDERRHHEIYLSDPRKGNPEKLKTVIRVPIRRKR